MQHGAGPGRFCHIGVEYVLAACMTQILPADKEGVAQASALLRAGELVAFGTETVYGLGGDATNADAVAAIFQAKGRPRFNPLICHYASAERAFRDVVADERALRVAAAFWPGPLTLVLQRRADCPVALLTGAGLDTLAVRVPGHPLAQGLLRAVGRPIAAPSANRSGRVSPTLAEHVRSELGDRVALVLDGGPCRVGIESTVLDLSREPAVLLRPGGLPQEALEGVLGRVAAAPNVEDSVARASPGMLASHYAPSLPVRLDVLEPAPGEAWLGFGPIGGARQPDLQLSETADLIEAAARLFAALRSLDRPGFTGIAVMPIPETGLGAAINDRLRRAAAPRE